MKRGPLSRTLWVGLVVGLILVFPAGSVIGGEAIPNWSAPATWSPHSAQRGLTTMADVTRPLPFIGLTPCRLVDTRGNGAPIQGGIFTGGSDVRNYGVGGICGIPGSARALSLNFTVTGPGQTGAGFLLAWPTAGPVPPVSILNWDHVPEQIANAAVVPTFATVVFSVNVSSPTHVIIDVNGYYAETPASSSSYFEVVASPWAIIGKNPSSDTLATGVLGAAVAETGNTIGVWGETLSSTDGARGVMGFAQGTTGYTYGVQGLTLSSSGLAAGVYGAANHLSASAGLFVNGIYTYLSYANFGLYTGGDIHALGALTISGSPKNFVAPHPVDPSKEIRYASVEAPTVDVYFRGTGTLANGYARIEIPDHFRFTAREGTYMTTLTPVGRWAGLVVESEGPEGIVVRGSGNTSFHYVVYAERAEIEGFEPVQKNVHFTPEMLEKVQALKRLPPSTTALLIQNGTLNPDGSYNETTARAMGWTIPKPSADRGEQARAAAAAFRATREAKGEN